MFQNVIRPLGTLKHKTLLSLQWTREIITQIFRIGPLGKTGKVKM